MGSGVHHDRGEDTGRAVVGREGLIQLGHHSADRGLFLDQIDLVAHIGQVQGCKYSGNAAADYQSRLGDIDELILKRLQISCLGHCACDNLLGLGGGAGLVIGMDPAVLVPDICHFKKIFVQTFAFQHFPEYGFMGPRSTGGDDYLVHKAAVDVLTNYFLTRI